MTKYSAYLVLAGVISTFWCVSIISKPGQIEEVETQIEEVWDDFTEAFEEAKADYYVEGPEQQKPQYIEGPKNPQQIEAPEPTNPFHAESPEERKFREEVEVAEEEMVGLNLEELATPEKPNIKKPPEKEPGYASIKLKRPKQTAGAILTTPPRVKNPFST